MINAQAVDQTFGIKPENLRVHNFKGGWLLNANTHQLNDIEETTPVNFIGRIAPARQTIMLTFK